MVRSAVARPINSTPSCASRIPRAWTQRSTVLLAPSATSRIPSSARTTSCSVGGSVCWATTSPASTVPVGKGSGSVTTTTSRKAARCEASGEAAPCTRTGVPSESFVGTAGPSSPSAVARVRKEFAK
jgi:hypothetical protein